MALSFLLICLCCIAIAWPIFRSDFAHSPLSFSLCIVLLWLAIRSFSKASRRQFGINAEFQAVQNLIRWVPSDWTVKQGVFIGAGDLDILVITPHGEKFAIEVKSQKAVALKGWFSKKLVRTGGAAFPRDPIAQARMNGERVGGEPILWFPLALQEKCSTLDGVSVVLGKKGLILRAIGLRSSFLSRLFSY